MLLLRSSTYKNPQSWLYCVNLSLMNRILNHCGKWVWIASAGVVLELETPRARSRKSYRSGFEKGIKGIEYRTALRENLNKVSGDISRHFSDTLGVLTTGEIRNITAMETRSKTSAARTSVGEQSGPGAEATKKTLPVPENPLVIRTDFSNQATWEAIVKTIKTTTPDGFDAYVEFLDDPAFQCLTSTQLLGLVSEYKSQHSFLMIVDELTITKPEHPLVVVNLLEDDEPVDEPQYGREFRAIPGAIQSIENNLTVANMSFEDFADSVDEDGVFRVFE